MKYLVMVCHAETSSEDGGWPDPQGFSERLGECRRAVARGGKVPSVTFCLTAEAARDQRDFFARLRDEGHEIGVHSHLPGSQSQRHSYSGRYAYEENEAGELNQDLAAGVIRQMVMEAGLGRPTTHVSGMFTFRDTTAAVLERSGFSTDCSLVPGERKTHEATGDFVLCDNRQRTCPAPYRLDRSRHCRPGNAAVLELPVWGHLNAKDDQASVEAAASRSQQTGLPMASLWEDYWRDRGALRDVPRSGECVEAKPEIVQMFFHYQDFMHKDDAVRENDWRCLRDFLAFWAESGNRQFATAHEATIAWERDGGEV